MVTDLDKFLVDNYCTKPKEYLEQETGIKFYTLRYKAEKLGLHRAGICKYCGKKSYKQHDNEWLCGDCYWNICGSRCVDCGKEVAGRSNRCERCKQVYVGRLNAKHDEKFCPTCGKKIAFLAKTCGGKHCRQRYAVFTGHAEDRICAVCSKAFIVTKYFARTKAAKFCSQKCYKDAFYPAFNKNRVFTHNGISMRSSWEVKIAFLLEQAKIKFEYEPQRIGNYIPDFLLPEYNIWLEVKGFMSIKSMNKIRDFRKKGYTLYIINEKIYNRLNSNEDIVQFLNRTSATI